MRKLRFGEIKQLAQSHTANEGWSLPWDPRGWTHKHTQCDESREKAFCTGHFETSWFVSLWPLDHMLDAWLCTDPDPDRLTDSVLFTMFRLQMETWRPINFVSPARAAGAEDRSQAPRPALCHPGKPNCAHSLHQLQFHVRILFPWISFIRCI